MILPRASCSSNRISHAIFPKLKSFKSADIKKANAPFGKGDIGSIAFEMSGITSIISITFTLIQSNMDG